MVRGSANKSELKIYSVSYIFFSLSAVQQSCVQIWLQVHEGERGKKEIVFSAYPELACKNKNVFL